MLLLMVFGSNRKRCLFKILQKLYTVVDRYDPPLIFSSKTIIKSSYIKPWVLIITDPSTRMTSNVASRDISVPIYPKDRSILCVLISSKRLAEWLLPFY